MQIHREIAGRLDLLLYSENVREDLTFVIGGTTSEDVTIFQNRLERRRVPKPDRIGGLDVVMTVNQNGAAARLLFIVRPNHRMARRGAKFGRQTDLSQFFHQPMPALGYFFRVMIVCRDAGETEELIKIFEMTCAHGWTVATQKRLSSKGRPLPSPKLYAKVRETPAAKPLKVTGAIHIRKDSQFIRTCV